MAKDESWYESYANGAKLITYTALLILLASIGWSAYSAWLEHQAGFNDFHLAMFSLIAGIATSAFLYGVAVIIGLLIVGCEALRNRR